MSLSIVVEGNIGSGKSTLLSILKDMFPDNLEILYEPVKEWQEMKNKDGTNLLGVFYNDISRYSYLFQSVAFRTRVKKMLEPLTKPIRIIERSPYADRYCFAQNCYESGMMTDIEWEDYTKWFDWLNDSFKIESKINGYIYLDCSSDTSFERIGIRERREEISIKREYLDDLNKKYKSWITTQNNVLILDANQNFEHNEKIRKNFINDISEFIKKLKVAIK